MQIRRPFLYIRCGTKISLIERLQSVWLLCSTAAIFMLSLKFTWIDAFGYATHRIGKNKRFSALKHTKNGRNPTQVKCRPFSCPIHVRQMHIFLQIPIFSAHARAVRFVIRRSSCRCFRFRDTPQAAPASGI